MTSPGYGDFGFRTVVGSFRPDVAEMVPSTPYFGLQQQAQYVWAILKTPSGPAIVQRKFHGSMTGGAYIMNTSSGNFGMDPATRRTARGEVRTSIDDKHRRYYEPLARKWPAGAAPEGEEPLDIEIRDRRVTWSEGSLLQLEGEMGDLGVQLYAPMPDEPFFYSTYPCRARGTLLGEEVEGVIMVEQGNWKHGIEPKEYAIYGRLEQSWNAFINLYEDSVQMGWFVRGMKGFACAMVVEGDQVVTMANDFTARYAVQEDNSVPAAVFEAAGDRWEFTSHPAGHMGDFAKSRPYGYGANGGSTVRVGDDRTPILSFGWFEYFTDRIGDDMRIS